MARPYAGVVSLLGLATYPLYLLHDNIGTYAIGTLIGFGATQSVAIVTTLVAMIGFSVFVTIGPEPAFRRWLARSVSRSSPQHAAVTGPRFDSPPDPALASRTVD